MAPINVSTSEQQITATVTGDNSVTATVQAGFGATGPQGPAATIAVGTVTTGAPGTSASVVNAGTSGAAVLNFTIPAGAAGATGPAGATGATGAKGDKGDTGDPASLPAGTEGYVLTYVSDEWVAAEPSGVDSLTSGDDTLALDGESGATFSFSGGACEFRFVSQLFPSVDGAIGVDSGNPDGLYLRGGDSDGGVRVYSTDTTLGRLTCADVRFGDQTIQSTAWTGTVDAASVTGLADVATSGDYADLTGTPAAYSLPTATNSVSGGVKIGSGVTITDGVISVSTSYAAASHTHAASDIASGTLSIDRIPTGTTSTTVALGNHTHTQLHDRSHAITSSSDHTAGNWKVIYSNGSGAVTELALGASGTVLTSGGESAAPTFSALPAGGTKSYAVFRAMDNQPPSTAFATLDTRNSVAVLDFDDATKESAAFAGIMPEAASLGSGLKIRLHWMATSATSGDVRWEVALERSTTDLDSDSFDTVQTGATTTSGTSGIAVVTEITLTTIDSVTAGDLFRLRVARDAANAADTMTGDAELVAVEVRSAA